MSYNLYKTFSKMGIHLIRLEIKHQSELFVVLNNSFSAQFLSLWHYDFFSMSDIQNKMQIWASHQFLVFEWQQKFHRHLNQNYWTCRWNQNYLLDCLHLQDLMILLLPWCSKNPPKGLTGMWGKEYFMEKIKVNITFLYKYRILQSKINSSSGNIGIFFFSGSFAWWKLAIMLMP